MNTVPLAYNNNESFDDNQSEESTTVEQQTLY